MSNVTNASYATMSDADFKKAWETSRARPSSKLSVTVGSKWIHVKTGASLTCVRLFPKARSCAFFATDAGELMYLNVSRDVTPAPVKQAK